LVHDKHQGRHVVSHNNDYAEDNPPFPEYATFSIFGDRVLTQHDLQLVLRNFNQVVAEPRAEEKFGPFDHANYNIAGQEEHNEQTWETAWKGYHENNKFTIPKGPLFQSNASYFNVTGYVDPEKTTGMPKIILGHAYYVGQTTTDKILLPQGKDKATFSPNARPLHPSFSKKSELITKQEADRRFWENVYKQKSWSPNYDFKSEDPYWYTTRKRLPLIHPHASNRLGTHGSQFSPHPVSTAGMFEPYAKEHETHCMNCL
jgi:hypothetical protein